MLQMVSLIDSKVHLGSLDLLNGLTLLGSLDILLGKLKALLRIKALLTSLEMLLPLVLNDTLVMKLFLDVEIVECVLHRRKPELWTVREANMPAITIQGHRERCFDYIRNRVAVISPNERLCGRCRKYALNLTPACWIVRYEYRISCSSRTYNRYMTSVMTFSLLRPSLFSYPE